jgi:hypothetical protein
VSGVVQADIVYSGPRMTYRHPVMAMQHLLDGRRKEPLRPEKTA